MSLGAAVRVIIAEEAGETAGTGSPVVSVS